jgi:hypoxanthine phosphoribosyltransferase
MYQQYIDRVLLDEATLQARIGQLAGQVSRDYATSENLLLVCVLRGGGRFLTDLMRRLTIPHEIDFMAVSSYGRGARDSSGVVRIMMDLKTNIEARDILIVEDIIDSGHTLEYLLRILRERAPASLEVCALLNKPSRREVEIPVKYLGFEIPDEFVFGYGLDLDERWRNLPFVASLRSEYIDPNARQPPRRI